MMQQYMNIKNENPDTILFFRLGDFYEMFFEDALLASRELEITLTQRDAGLAKKAPMCGVPYHVANTYISRLINKGYKVAICDQVEDPKLAKGLVRREVTQIITPGTFTDIDYLKTDENNYLMSIYLDEYQINISYVDYSTGELFTGERVFLDQDSMFSYMADEIYRLMPSEILINEFHQNKVKKYLQLNRFYFNPISKEQMEECLNRKYFGILSEKLLTEIEDLKNNHKISHWNSIAMILNYLIETQKNQLNHINSVHYYDNQNYLILDESSKQNLELIQGLNTNSKKGSLLEILDNCVTAMGSRKLKKWVQSPLIDKDKICYRYDLIDAFLKDLILLDDIKGILKTVYDIERLSVKIANGTVNPREIDSLKRSIGASHQLKELLSQSNEVILQKLGSRIPFEEEVFQLIDKILMEDPPALIEENRIIRQEYDKRLDELFIASEEGRNWILNFEQNERNKTGIKNLKVKYNKILGYFIDITKSNLNLVPENYIRKQTLVGSERFFSMELKEMESKILGSKEQALNLQLKIFNDLKNKLLSYLSRIQKLANVLASLDCIISLTESSRINRFKRPNLNEDGVISIIDGRHPIVEYNFKEEFFVPNDTVLDLDQNMIHIITGPNMAGKSTYMRQVALIAIMAHIGCFVPCEEADISILDRVFTRIGASDNLAKGESTFMVEMKEVANIVSHSTTKSLLILDEVGRGTSTYDGLAIAWAIIEFIAEEIKAKTLFATHYHELVVLADKYDEIDNLTIAVKRDEDEMIFLRRIIEGFSNHSYGIDVAKLAGIDPRIIHRANDILKVLESQDEVEYSTIQQGSFEHIQENIFDQKKEKLIKKIKDLDINQISPIQAFNILHEIIKESRET
ncbi:MAG: DNA mismatch repair protein MutS [Tissierellia bacterium]|nr:DNA mismatch repair protein MutS [Tissierellia bacterium]